MRIDYAVVFVTDMQRAVEFYRDTVGVPLKFQSPGWTEFATEGSTLALHATDKVGSGDSDGTAGTCRTGFTVSDLDEFHQRMLNAEVPCNQEPREVFGHRIAQYVDPDGMVFGVSELRAVG